MVRRAGTGIRPDCDLGEEPLSAPFPRVVVLVCDGLGVGAAPDAVDFGDAHADTLGHVLTLGHARVPNLASLGLGNLPPTCSAWREASPTAAFGRLAEKSAGKDTATGHWEMMGLLTETAFKLFPEGFPASLIDRFSKETGQGVLGNKAASGTEILKELGDEHVQTGALIVYTSGDSVFQIKENVIGGAAGGLVDHRGVRCRNGKFGALQPLFAQRVKGVAHLFDP